MITGQPVPVTSNGLPIGVPETVEGFSGEPLERFDSPSPWMHGYFQEIPAYGGFGAFRPYNYKHILSQSQAAGGWGMAPRMPYSQQFWHRYRARAGMRPSVSGPPVFRQPVRTSPYTGRSLSTPPPAGYVPRQRLAPQPVPPRPAPTSGSQNQQPFNLNTP
ncbi:MAG: hypothetical protein Tsb009_00610 [Planctomycetaceae bacterium]